MKKIVFTYGSITGVIVAVILIATVAACYNNPGVEGMWMGFTAMWLAFIFLFIGVKKYRDKFKNGIITFWEAFKIGVLIALVASTIYVATWLIDYYVFIPDFLDKYLLHVVAEAQKDGKTLTEINEARAEAVKNAQMYKNPVMVVLLTYMEIFPLGLLVALISALVLKRKAKT